MATEYPKLIVLSGSEEGQEFGLKGRDSVSVGRSDENDFILSDSSVSRRHATFTFKNNKWFVRDESSRNGSFINENKIDQNHDVELENLKVIRFGVYDLRYVERDVSQEEINTSINFKKKNPEKEAPPVTETPKKKNANDDVNLDGLDGVESSLETDKEELEKVTENKDNAPLFTGPKMGKGMLVFGLIAIAFVLLAITLYTLNDKEGFQDSDEKNSVTDENSNVDDEPIAQSNIAITPSATNDAEDLTMKAPDLEIKPADNQVKQNQDATVITSVPVSDFQIATLADGTQEPLHSDNEFSIFLDVKTSPSPAVIYFQGERLGVAPFKRNIKVNPNQTYKLDADFDLRELNDIYRKSVDFKVKPDSDVIEMDISGEIGVLKILKLPRQVDFYLEGFYAYDKIKANPVKIDDIIYGKPIYLPYGTYHVELKEKSKLEGSDNLITQVRFQREYTIDADNKEIELSVADKDLQFFPAVINSNPSNADVYYNNDKVGVTPFTGPLPQGAGKIKIVKEGYFASQINLDIRMNSIYETTVTLKTSTMGELLNKAKELIRGEQTNDAINTLVEALKYGGSAKEKAEAYYLLGNAYFAKKSFDTAKPYYEKAAEQKGFFLQAKLGLAKTLHELNQNDLALKQVVEVLVNLKPETSPAIRTEANVVFKQISSQKSVIYLYTDPPGAKVKVNDKLIDQETPMILSDLVLRNYRLQFEKTGYQVYKTQQNILIGEFVLIKVKLTPENL